MTRIITRRGVSWLLQPKPVPAKQREYKEIRLACRRCSEQRGRFRSIRHAMADGWRQIERFKWRTEPCCNYRGLCPFCRKHPEEEG